MRFAIAFVTLLVAALLVAGGVAERTILKPAESVTTAFSVPQGARYVVIPGSVLRSHPGQQRLQLSGSTVAFAAYGKAADVTAWLSGERYARLAVSATGQPVAATTTTAPTVAGLPSGGTPDPDGSDLWLDQRSGSGGLDWPINVPASVSVIVAADGASPAPTSIRITWPLTASTPFALPLILAGAVVAVIGLLLYVWALVHLRRRRGPRRKPPPKLPKRPQPPKYRPAKAPVVTSTRGRRSVVRFAARPAGAAGVLLAGAVALTGCSVHALPAAGSPASAPPKATVVQAVVAEAQAQRIVHEVALVAEKADAKRSATILATRFGGPALELRQAAYAIRKKDKKAVLPQAVPDPATLRLILPERTTTWPRTLFTVATDGSDAKVPPLALALVQNDPRSNYQVEYAMSLQPNAKLPDVPSAMLGASRLAADTSVLKVSPNQIGMDYGLLLRKPQAADAQVFDIASDDLVGSVGAKAKAAAVKKSPTAKFSFSTVPTDNPAIALSTADAGALVAVNLDEQWLVKPKSAGVTVTTGGETKALAGTGSTTTGFASVYGYQLLFAVPSAGSKEPVVLLGYAQGLVSAKEL